MVWGRVLRFSRQNQLVVKKEKRQKEEKTMEKELLTYEMLQEIPIWNLHDE